MEIRRVESFVDQVVEVIRERVATGEYGPGYKLPSENELSRELNISRTTVRSAYIKLSAAGVVKQIHGAGTYIREFVPDLLSAKNAKNTVWDFIHLIENQGYKPSIKGLRINQRTAKEAEAKALGLSMKDVVVSVRRIFYADNDPVFYSQNVYSANMFDQDIIKLDLNLGLYDFTKRYTDQELVSVLLTIGGGLEKNDSEEISQNSNLNIEENSFWIRLEEIFYNREEMPLVYGMTYVQNLVLPIRIGLTGFDK